MKSKEFASFAVDVSEMLSQNGAPNSGAAWRQLAAIFEIKPAAKVADVCRLFKPAEHSGLNDGNVSIIVDGLPGVMKLLAQRSKKDILGDLQTLAAALSQVRGFSLDALAHSVATNETKKKPKASSKLNAEVVEKYVSALENSFRDAVAFNVVFSTLKNDKSLKPIDLKSIAKQFSGASVKTKTEAHKAIWRLHEEILIDRAKAAATGGRTAA